MGFFVRINRARPMVEGNGLFIQCFLLPASEEKGVPRGVMLHGRSVKYCRHD